MRDIHVEVPLDDSLQLLCFLHASIKMMRIGTEGINNIDCEINISIVERFNENLTKSVTSQVGPGEIADAINFLS